MSTVSADTLNEWKRAHDDALEGIESLWVCVHHILCADAPEGHIPEDMDEEVSLDTKEILSYSWRGLKEARYVIYLCSDAMLRLQCSASHYHLQSPSG
jgi:hypothetical protein